MLKVGVISRAAGNGSEIECRWPALTDTSDGVNKQDERDDAKQVLAALKIEAYGSINLAK